MVGGLDPPPTVQEGEAGDTQEARLKSVATSNEHPPITATHAHIAILLMVIQMSFEERSDHRSSPEAACHSTCGRCHSTAGAPQGSTDDRGLYLSVP